MSCCEEEEEEEGCGGGEECSRVYVVHDNSWNEEFKVEFSRRRFGCRCGCGQFQENGYPCVHALFVLHQKNMLDKVDLYIDEGYLRKNVAKTCLNLPVGWMDKLQGLEGVEKSELVEESQKEEYALYVYDLWKKASTLTHRLYSRGEQDTNKFLERKKGIKEDQTCLISSREGEEYRQDEWSYLRTG